MKRLTPLLVVLLLAGTVAPAPASADFLEKTGEVLKKGWEGTKSLVKKGVDGVKSLFGGGASEEKLPTQMKKVDETQRTLAKKQENLISYYNTSRGSSASNPFIQERVNDLRQATEENEKAYAELADNLAKLEKKKADLTEYRQALDRLKQGQEILAKNQATLERNTGPLVAKASGTEGDAPGEKARSEVAFGAYDAQADDGTTAGDESEQTVNGFGQTAPGAPGGAPALTPGLLPGGEPNPDDPKVLALMEQWLGMNGLDSWGRVVDANVIAADKPDLNGQTRGRWLWTNLAHTNMHDWVKSRLGTASAGAAPAVAAAPPAAAALTPLPEPTTPQAKEIVSETQNLSEANAAAGKSVTEIQSMMENGQGQSDGMKAALERYRQQKAARDAAISSALQDPSNQMQATDR